MFQRDILPPMYLNIINEISFKEQIEELEEVSSTYPVLLKYNYNILIATSYGNRLAQKVFFTVKLILNCILKVLVLPHSPKIAVRVLFSPMVSG